MQTQTLTVPQAYNPSVERRAEPLTENGFTVAEEMRILRILQDIRSGKAKTYSDEEAALYLGLDD